MHTFSIHETDLGRQSVYFMSLPLVMNISHPKVDLILLHIKMYRIELKGNSSLHIYIYFSSRESSKVLTCFLHLYHVCPMYMGIWRWESADEFTEKS